VWDSPVETSSQIGFGINDVSLSVELASLLSFCGQTGFRVGIYPMLNRASLLFSICFQLTILPTIYKLQDEFLNSEDSFRKISLNTNLIFKGNSTDA